MVSPPDAPDAVSVSRLLDAAREAGGADHRFRVLQLPMNVLETGAFLVRNTGPDGSQTPLDFARNNEVAVLLNRPLNAFAGGRMIRLADISVDDQAVDFGAQVARVRKMEQGFRSRIAPQIQLPEGAVDPAKFFTWADQLGALGSRPLTLEQCAHVTMQVQYSVTRIAHALDQSIPDELGKRWAGWRDTYYTELGKLLGELRRRAARRSQTETRRIGDAVDPLLPQERREQSLSRKALWIVASTPGVTSVLNGMRTPEYVQDALGVLDWTPLEDVRRVYDALNALRLEE